MSETFPKTIQAPVLSPMYGQNTKETFENIDENFKVLSNRELYKGDPGQNLISISLPWSEVFKIPAGESTYVETIQIGEGDDAITINNFADDIITGLSAIGADVQATVDQLKSSNWSIVVCLHEGESDVLSCIPFVYVDYRFRNTLDSSLANKTDMSCVITCNGVGTWACTQNFPTIYYKDGTLYWKINGQNTSIVACGPAGKDGATGAIYVGLSDNLKLFATGENDGDHEGDYGGTIHENTESVDIQYMLCASPNITAEDPRLSPDSVSHFPFLTIADWKTINGTPMSAPILVLPEDVENIPISTLEGSPYYVATAIINDNGNNITVTTTVNKYNICYAHMTEAFVKNTIINRALRLPSDLSSIDATRIPGYSIKEDSNSSTAGYCIFAPYGTEPMTIAYVANVNAPVARSGSDTQDTTHDKFIIVGSLAEGWNTTAGDYAHAEGKITTANGTAAHAEGQESTAKGDQSHAEGYNTKAYGQASHTEGHSTIAGFSGDPGDEAPSGNSGNQSHAEGYYTKAKGAQSHAEGLSTTATGVASHAEGNSTEAYGSSSHAEGRITKANGAQSHAEGLYTKAQREGAHAEGCGSSGNHGIIAGGFGSHAEGYSVHNTTNGVLDGEINASGNGAHAEGYADQNSNKITASGSGAHAEGCATGSNGEIKASGNGAHAEGCTTASNTIEAKGTGSHAEGMNTKAYGTASHAEGYKSEAGASGSTNHYSHAEGYYTKATGEASHAEGYGSSTTQVIASAQGAHAEGKFTTASGQGSHAEGWETNAKSSGSHAEGYNTEAGSDQGNYAHAEGQYTRATKSGSHAEGYGANATDCIKATGAGAHAEGYTTSGTIEAAGTGAHAEGETTKAYGKASHAEGYKTEAGASSSTNHYSHAEGQQTKATGTASHAEGSSTTASGTASHAEGYDTTAEGNYSHVEGYNTTATGLTSHAEGSSTTASGVDSHAEGHITTASTTYAHAEGDGTTASGEASHAEGQSTRASGVASHVEGSSNIATGENSHAEGYNSAATGENSHAEGDSNTAYGNASHAEGYGCEAGSSSNTNHYSHAEGYQSKATGAQSHAEGYNTTASGADSHAEGGSTTASNTCAHAEGVSTTASGQGSHAEGNSTTASAPDSHAEGNSTTASAPDSHAEGNNTKAFSDNSHTEGFHTSAFFNPTTYKFSTTKIKHPTVRWGKTNSGTGVIWYSLTNSMFKSGSINTIKNDENIQNLIKDLFNGVRPVSSAWYNWDEATPVGGGDSSRYVTCNKNNMSFVFTDPGTTNTPEGFAYYNYGSAGPCLILYNHSNSSMPNIGATVTGTGFSNFTSNSYWKDENRSYALSVLYNNNEGIIEIDPDKTVLFCQHAEGVTTTAIGQASHAEGYLTEAAGDYSHAQGLYTQTRNESEFAAGQYNASGYIWKADGANLYAISSADRVGTSTPANSSIVVQYPPTGDVAGSYTFKPLLNYSGSGIVRHTIFSVGIGLFDFDDSRCNAIFSDNHGNTYIYDHNTSSSDVWLGGKLDSNQPRRNLATYRKL